ncbi:YihY family inner membrane protein [Curvibacter sp. CHRR-16]|uniref:YihY family inner membrane protein n=1 Tax=Curvibacter sp. CHRR-16 TaxID=2835872 RepID=UPI001BD98366|nr:YihY family inner membrane protein [Curvibacter sp. CHRR-16]MBT0569120.1 YihY family inner membrane protein [Curvibacter sp. CHRR-16]
MTIAPTALYRLRLWLREVASIPWRDALLTLRERFREDRLALTASSLTFTTIIALVPLFTLALAIFTAFPMFAKFQDVLQKWLVQSLVPDSIARQVLGYLSTFARQANKLGMAGLSALLISALALVFTIDRTLNSIWRVRRRRPFGQRLLIYWTAITLGPLLLGASLALTSYALASSKGWLPGGVGLALDVVQFVLVATGMACTFHYIPNTEVRWGHAWMGGWFVASGLELARRGLAFYIAKVPTYSLVYGAFATVPILLVWVYIAWVIVLLGAALTAYLPALLSHVPRRKLGNGWQFQLGLEALQLLYQARLLPERGLSLPELCRQLQVDTQRLETVLEALQQLDWVGQLHEGDASIELSRHVLLVEPEHADLGVLAQRLLLQPHGITFNWWKNALQSPQTLRDVL